MLSVSGGAKVTVSAEYPSLQTQLISHDSPSGLCWIFTLQNKRCKFNMAAITLCLPPAGLIGCLGEFLRGMGNESNIYCRVRAGGDIHCINLTWPPLQRQKAGLWDGHASWSGDSEETEVQVGTWSDGYKREERGHAAANAANAANANANAITVWSLLLCF